MHVARTLTATLFTGLLLVGSQAFAQTSVWKIDPAHSQADFQVKHMAVSNVRGSLGPAAGEIHLDEKDITKSSVVATVDVKAVDTRVEARDKDLRSAKYFNVDQYPTLTFKSTKITQDGSGFLLIGDLTLAGVTKPVTLKVDGPTPPQKNQKGQLITGFSATGTIKRSDFNFGAGTPGAIVSEDVKITIDVEADKQ